MVKRTSVPGAAAAIGIAGIARVTSSAGVAGSAGAARRVATVARLIQGGGESGAQYGAGTIERIVKQRERLTPQVHAQHAAQTAAQVEHKNGYIGKMQRG